MHTFSNLEFVVALTILLRLAELARRGKKDGGADFIPDTGEAGSSSEGFEAGASAETGQLGQGRRAKPLLCFRFSVQASRLTDWGRVRRARRRAAQHRARAASQGGRPGGLYRAGRGN